MHTKVLVPRVAAVLFLVATMAGCNGPNGAAEDASGRDAGAIDAATAGDAATEGDAARGDTGTAPVGFPGPDDTGIPEGACPGGLTPAPSEAMRPESGSTWECLRFAEFLPYLPDTVSDVTFRHCRFETTDGDAFINLQGGPVLIEESEMIGGAGTWIRASYEAHGLTVRRSEFAGMANAVEWGTNDVVLEDNYVHDFGNVSADQHADGFQTEGAARFVLRHNTILMGLETWGATSALLVSGTESIIEDNLVGGAGYTIHVAGDIDVTGNRVTTMFSESSGEYGPVYPESLDASGSWSDNAWYDGPNAGMEIEAP